MCCRRPVSSEKGGLEPSPTNWLTYVDRWCWNIGGPCSGGSATTAGPDEVACSNIGAGDVNWCCNSQFGGCTQTTFQQNNCWSNFQNPIRNLNPLNAASSASSAKQIGLTQPTLTNIIVSTLAGGGWLAEFTATSTSSSRNTLSPTSSTMALPAPSGSMSGGTIAGIVIGVIAIISSTAAVWFVFWNRRKRHRGIYESTQRVAEPLQKVAPPIEISSFPVGRHYHTDGPIELPAGHEAHAYELRSGR